MNEVRIRKTIKFGHGDNARIYLEGEVLRPPLPPEILHELAVKSGLVEYLSDIKVPELYNPNVREVYRPDFGPRGNVVVAPKRPTVVEPKIATSTTRVIKGSGSDLPGKKPLVLKRSAVENKSKELGKQPEKPKIKLSLRTR